MSRRQYRWQGTAFWQSQSGNAIIALINPIGSGKKHLVHRVEIHNFQYAGPTGSVVVGLVRGTFSDTPVGESVNVVAADLNNSPPSGLTIMRNCTVTISGAPIMVSASYYQTTLGSQALPQSIHLEKRIGKTRQFWSNHVRLDTSLEGIVIRQNECIALVSIDATMAQVFSINGLLIANGKSFYFSAVPCVAGAPGGYGLLGIFNSGTTPIHVKYIDIRECGTRDTPYFQLVPVGAINPDSYVDTVKRLTPVPMDTNYGALSSEDGLLLADAPLLPFGVPQAYLAEGSTGSPKGFSYLHTKDFIGPQYMVMFPEYNAYGRTAPDIGQGLLHKNSMIFSSSRGDPLIIREGEGLALVSGAETAVTTNPVGTSGWQPFEIAIQFSVEPKQIPIIKATGMVVGSRWILQRYSDNSIVASGITTDGTMEYEYTYDDVPLDIIFKVRKGSSSPYYKPYEVVFQLTADGITIPVSQIPDA